VSSVAVSSVLVSSVDVSSVDVVSVLVSSSSSEAELPSFGPLVDPPPLDDGSGQLPLLEIPEVATDAPLVTIGSPETSMVDRRTVTLSELSRTIPS